ncbi:MAG: TfoX/Sxy family protein [Mycobacteriaceae bacterium]
MDEHGGLLQRVRDALAATSVVREVNMFGGRAFMVNEKMLVSVGRGGDLLVRVDPDRSAELLAVAGARQAEMGAGRSMGNGWITVAEQTVGTEEALTFWISVATGYNDKAADWGSRRRP